MLRAMLIACALILVLLFNVCAYAQDENMDSTRESAAAIETNNIPYKHSPINKFGRGLINTVTCWAEIPGQVAVVSKEQNPAIGMTLGLGEGMFTMLLRGATGLVDVFTFFMPPYDKPLMQPEYAIVDADKKVFGD